MPKPNYVWVRNEGGSEYAVVESAFNPEYHTAVDGAEVEVDANGLPRLKQSEPTAPKQSDNKSVWMDYAVAQGADPAEAEGSTKAELIEKYGN